MSEEIHLSSVQSISEAVQRDNGDYSTVKTMGSLVNNRKFKEGFDQFITGESTTSSYIWSALSAASEDLGQTLFSNVQHYIDNVSNIDTCKVKSLKSMMHMLDINYIVLDKIGYYPIEIQSLLDLMSINPKYLLDNKFIKQDFINALCADGVIQLCNDIDPYAVSAGNAYTDADKYIYDQNTLDNYISSVFFNFIDDMMNMSSTAYDHKAIYKMLSVDDGYGENAEYEDKYLKKKRANNIDVQFNVEQVVDDIELGLQKLDDYAGPKRQLIDEEIAYRKQPRTDLPNLDLTTRYTWYKKQKVIEYARFVDSMCVPLSNFTSQVMYTYDSSYFILSGPQQQNWCISGIGTSDVAIVSNDIATAAEALAHVTRYIRKLREVVRLQVRKVFMKGTNNLLRYTINEFLIDYIDYLKSNFDISQISDIVAQLSSHSLSSVAVQEYWDNTEYMNISCVTTKYSENADLANQRYFDNAFYRENGLLIPYQTGIFTNAEINKFYLDELGLKNTLGQVVPSADAQNKLSSNFYEFLSVLFDVAANTSYYDSNGHFGMKLADETITQTIDADLLCASTICVNISSLAEQADYSFLSSQTVKTQLEDFQNAIYSMLSNNYLSAVSSTYNAYSPNVSQMSSEFDAQSNALSTFLNVTYANYFCKSTNEYSYNEDGSYKYPYYVDNPNILTDTVFIQQLTQAKDWINASGNCKTWPVLEAIQQLSSDYDSTYGSISEMTESLKADGFIDMNLPNLADEMDSIQTYLNQKIAARNTYLQNALDNLRNQAQDVKASFDTIETSFAAALANMPDTTQGYYFTINNVVSGESNYRIVDGTKGKSPKDDGVLVYDQFSSCYFRKSDTKGTKNSRIYIKAPFINSVPSSGSLQTRIVAAIALIEECQNIFYGKAVNSVTQLSTVAAATSPRPHGTTEDTLNAIAANYKRVSNQISSIASQASELFNLGTDSGSILYPATNTAIAAETRIVNLIEILGTKITEKNFNDDSIMRDYNVQMSSLMGISSSYIPAKDEYEVLWQKFSEFFNDFTKAGDYKTFTPDNISKVNDYTVTKDSTALAKINSWFDDAIGQYDGLVQQFIDLVAPGIYLYTSVDGQTKYEYSGDAIELLLADLSRKLQLDVVNREAIGRDQLEKEYENVQLQINAVSYGLNPQTKKPGLYRKYFPDALGEYVTNEDYMQKFYSQHVPFIDLVKQIIDKLYYDDRDEYIESKLMFQNYSGIPHIANDPYYNVKNQTHPSYQIHPLLWNFTEKHVIDQTLEMISQTLTHINYDELEKANAAKYLDIYLGEFGNLIDVWKTHVNDFTGYKTRYESSNHICRYTNAYSPVVDYDGAFYPPALDVYLSSQDHSLLDLSAFYSHLNVLDNEISAKVDSSLKSNFDAIQQMTQMHSADDEYDIYKYQLDAYGNIYILYKQYGSAKAPEFQKMTTAGELWIRLTDSPIAFPLSDVYETDPEGIDYDDVLSMKIYDFEILQSGKKCIITYLSDDGTTLKSIPLYIKYNLAESAGIGNLTMYDFDIDDGDVDKQTAAFPVGTPGENSYWGYCGCYQIDASVVDVIYVSKDHRLYSSYEYIQSNITDNPDVMVYTVTTDSNDVQQKHIKFDGLSNVIGELPGIAYNADNSSNRYVNIAFAIQRNDKDQLMTSSRNLSVDDLSGAAGATFFDMTDSQMNSFDQFTSDIAISKIYLSNINKKQDMLLKMNSDMGYIPSYAYSSYSNVLDLKDDISRCHQAVTLLGKSKDIEQAIDNVNESPDPYLSKEEIYSSKLYGRVYESDDAGNPIDMHADNTLNIWSNRSMYINMPDEHYDDQHTGFYGNAFAWDIILNKYSKDSLMRQRLFIYNTKCLGKNPYVVIDLSSVIEASEHLGPEEFLPMNYNTDDDIGGCVLSSLNYKTYVCGTLDGMHQVDINFSNSITNIKDIKYKYIKLGVDKYLNIMFDLKDPHAEGFILQDSIKVALVDDLNLKFFEWYHYLDPGITLAGAVQVLNDINADPVTSAQLAQIDLTEFLQLSDVTLSNSFEILRTDRRLQFKISEEDIFPYASQNYYVPSLNTRYPMTLGQYYKKSYIDPALAENEIRIYNEDEVYVLDVQDEQILSSIGDIAIELDGFQIIDEYRVYEDYFHKDDYGIVNADKYPIDDPRFFQYVHFAATSCETSGSAISGKYVPDSIIDNVRVKDNDKFSQFIEQSLLSGMHSEDDIGFLKTTTKYNYEQLDEADKQNFLDKVKDLLKLYFIYKKTDEGIVLYVNYQNYINSPFVKIQNGKPYIDIISGTYAKILPDEDALLNIVIQFRQFNGNDIVGVKNIIVATYQICNISDDKPKFIARKMSQAKPGQYKLQFNPYMFISGQLMTAPDPTSSFPFLVQLDTNAQMTSDVTCKIRYPSNNLEFIPDDPPSRYISKFANGILDCRFTSLHKVHSLTFKPQPRRDGHGSVISFIDIKGNYPFNIDSYPGGITVPLASSNLGN